MKASHPRKQALWNGAMLRIREEHVSLVKGSVTITLDTTAIQRSPVLSDMMEFGEDVTLPLSMPALQAWNCCLDPEERQAGQKRKRGTGMQMVLGLVVRCYTPAAS